MLTELSRTQLLEKRKNKEMPEKTDATDKVVKKSATENKNIKKNAKEAEE